MSVKILSVGGTAISLQEAARQKLLHQLRQCRPDMTEEQCLALLLKNEAIAAAKASKKRLSAEIPKELFDKLHRKAKGTASQRTTNSVTEHVILAIEKYLADTA